MGDYPNDAPDVLATAVRLSDAAICNADKGRTITVLAHFNQSSWGQAVLVHEYPPGQGYNPETFNPIPIKLNPPDFIVGPAKDCSVTLPKNDEHDKTYMISAWAWYGGTATGQPHSAMWQQVPLNYDHHLPGLDLSYFFGQPDPYYAPGAAGDVHVQCRRG
jgi:hypothetical protein